MHPTARQPSPWFPRVGNPLWRWVVAVLIAAAARLRLRLVWLGPLRCRLAPGTLVVMNHKTDWDGPALASALYFRGGRRAPNRQLSFLARGDLNRPGFLARYFLGRHRWLAWALGRFSLAAVTRALGIRVVPGLSDPAAGEREERVREIRVHLAGAARELELGGCVLLAPEGQLSPDGSLQRLSGSLARLARAARLIHPVSLTYDWTTPRRPSLFIRLGAPVTSEVALSAGPRNLEREIAARLRAGTVFGLGQVVGLLDLAGGKPTAWIGSRHGDSLARAARAVARALAEAGALVDPWLARSTAKEIERRLRPWLRALALLPVSAPGSLGYCRREAADGLAALDPSGREHVLAVALAAMTAKADRPSLRVLADASLSRPRFGRLPQPVASTIIVILTTVAVVLGLGAVPLAEAMNAVAGMATPWVWWAGTINLAGYLARVPVWEALLSHSPTKLGRREAFDLYLGGDFINTFVPLRGGDAARVIYLAREVNLGVARAAALVMAEHVFDLVVIAGLGAAGLLLSPEAPAWARRLVLGFLAGATTASGLTVALGPGQRRLRKRWQIMVAPLAAPGDALRDSRPRGALIAGIALANLAGPASTLALFRAAGLPAPAGPFLLASALVTIGAGIPVTVANLGAYELTFSAVYGLFLGYPVRALVPVAMVSHAISIVTVLFLGGLGVMRLSRQALPSREAASVGH